MHNPSILTAPAAAPGNGALPLLLLKLRTLIALAAVVLFFTIAIPDFLGVANILILARHVALNALLAIGMTYVIISGGIDLSVGSIAGLSGMVAGALILHGVDLGSHTLYFNVPGVIALCLALGAAIGAINGLLITRLQVAPFMATLGTLYVARGAALLLSDGATFSDLGGDAAHGTTGFPWLGTGAPLGIPVLIWLMIVVGAVAAYVSAKTPLGRHLYAVGGNERAATLSGVKVRRVKMLVYMFSGCCAALVGLVIASQLVAAHPLTGETFELNAIAAAVLGGTSMSGGRGKISGTIIGAFVIGILADGMIMMGVSAFWQTVIKGLVIIAAVVIDQAQQKMQRRYALRQQSQSGN
jgi:erythritol transport system permease protein